MFNENDQTKGDNMAFVDKYEKFILSCDALEEANSWDKETYGEMEAYFGADFINVAMQLMAADKEITEEEVNAMNALLGFQYTVEEVQEIYRDYRQGIDRTIDEEVRNSYQMAKGIMEPFGEAYISLVETICDLITNSDHNMSEEEKTLAEKLKRLR